VLLFLTVVLVVLPLTRLLFAESVKTASFNGSIGSNRFFDGGCLVLIVDRLVSDFFTFDSILSDLVLTSSISILVDSVVFDESFFWHRRSNKNNIINPTARKVKIDLQYSFRIFFHQP
jgi:hypothetical protein